MPYQSDFHEERFPTDIAFGSSGGPERSTEIVVLGSGREHRNQRWSQSKRRYEAGYGAKDLDALHAVVAFFEARRGPLFGFRYRDVLDWKSCAPLAKPKNNDQIIGIGDGTRSEFSLVKTYGDAEDGYKRDITKPVAGSVLVAVDGTSQTEGVDFQLDEASGRLVFAENSIPGAEKAITAGFEFDVPVRFASDQLVVSVAAFKAGEVPSIPLVEVVI